MRMSNIISMLNKLSVSALCSMTTYPNTLRLWCEDGRIAGFQNGDDGKLHKEIPTQTANPSGD